MGIVETLVTALTEMLTGSVSAITQGFTSLFFTTDGNLSQMGVFMIVFAGIGAAIGLVYVLLNIFRKK